MLYDNSHIEHFMPYLNRVQKTLYTEDIQKELTDMFRSIDLQQISLGCDFQQE